MEMNESRPLKLFGRGLLLLLAVAATASVVAKNDGSKKSVHNAQPAKTYTGSVYNKNGKSIPNVDIAVEDGLTNADGIFVTKQRYGTTYAVVADGHSIYWGILKADIQNVCRLDNAGQTSPYGFKNPHVVVNGKYINGCNLNNYSPEQMTVIRSTDNPLNDYAGEIMKRYAVTGRSIMKRGIVFVKFNERVRFVRPDRKGTYTIRVTDKDGNPIEGAHICIHRTYTNGQGGYSVQAYAGDMLAVGKRRYMSQCQEFGEMPTVDVEIKPNANRKSAEIGTEPENDNAVTRTAVMPKFRNGDLSTFRNWVRYNMRHHYRYPRNRTLDSSYPQLFMASRNRPLVSSYYQHPMYSIRVRFVIDYDGTLTDINVLKSNNPITAKVIVETLKTSPRWSPGRDINGENVRVRYTMNFRFAKDAAESYDIQRSRVLESESWGEN